MYVYLPKRASTRALKSLTWTGSSCSGYYTRYKWHFTYHGSYSLPFLHPRRYPSTFSANWSCYQCNCCFVAPNCSWLFRFCAMTYECQTGPRTMLANGNLISIKQADSRWKDSSAKHRRARVTSLILEHKRVSTAFSARYEAAKSCQKLPKQPIVLLTPLSLAQYFWPTRTLGFYAFP